MSKVLLCLTWFFKYALTELKVYDTPTTTIEIYHRRCIPNNCTTDFEYSNVVIILKF